MGPFESEKDYCNTKLLDTYGRTFDRPTYRVVWGDNETEFRKTTHSKEGILLANPVIMEFPKYKQWNRGKYILESIVQVPTVSDLTTAINYEPVFTFMGPKKEMLPPKWEVCLIVINSLHKAMNQHFGGKYKQSDEEIARIDRIELDRIHEMLFGNETTVTDALAYGSGVSLSGSYSKDKE